MPDGDLSGLAPGGFDLIQPVFTFDNIPTQAKKVALLGSLRRLLAPRGRLVSLVSTPDIYRNEEDYRAAYRAAGLTVHATYRPLGCPTEPVAWVSETTIAPWAIYVLGDAMHGRA